MEEKKINALRGGGIINVLQIAMPLVAASACHAANIFTDRVMLSHYSQEAMAAAFPAGMTCFSLSCFFIGIVAYSGSFVAQYSGANRPERIGTTVWQAVFLALTGGAVMAGMYFAAPLLFGLFGHSEPIRQLEVEYFRFLTCGAWINLCSIALSCFWSGRGLTRMVMAVCVTVTMINIPLNWLFIYGREITFPWGWVLAIPEQGITGAAKGTLLSGFTGMMIYLTGFLAPRSHRREFGVLRRFADWKLLCRIVRFGLPNGIQFALDLTAFNAFVIILGKISDTALAAGGIAFGCNNLSFTPMLGVGQAVSILVGQCIGAKDIRQAERVVRSASYIVLGYMAFMAIFFAIWPDPVIALFDITDPAVERATRIMLRFIAAYMLFDGLFIIYTNAIKGAGDTRFAMWTGISLAWFLYAIPCMAVYYLFSRPEIAGYFGDAAPDWCLWTMWSICVLYIMTCGAVFYLRYRHGAWKSMRVIEN